jgi:hypothetical protein
MYRIDGVFRCCEKDCSETSAPAVRTETDIGSQDLPSSPEEVLEILPLTIEGQIPDKKMPIRIRRRRCISIARRYHISWNWTTYTRAVTVLVKVHESAGQ